MHATGKVIFLGEWEVVASVPRTLTHTYTETGERTLVRVGKGGDGV